MKSKEPTKLGQVLTASLLLTLTGCATMMGSAATKAPPVSSFCLLAKPIYWSTQDTDDTIRQAKSHNAVGKTLCGWGTKAPEVG